MQTLKDGRREVYEQVQREVEAKSKQMTTKQLKLTFFTQERDKWLNRTDNKHRQFCMVAVHYLNKKIRQHTN